MPLSINSIKFPIFNTSDIFTAFDAHDEALENWNGDNDGPKDRAYDRLENDLCAALKKVWKEAYEAGVKDATQLMRDEFNSAYPSQPNDA